ncbi:hypothetical protein ACFQPA_11700 [Halomarina halobia]|uniref:Uncharacterized protein n=1 Tax=Halomarina halobia TaxID=3033386 RepID=A0ABD6A9G7_9EURY|nr:hypothetical protein [Halomarina sp. PSR21]
MLILRKDADFLALDEPAHAGVLFIVHHRRSAYEIASAVIAIAEAFPSRDHLRDVVYIDDWL